MSEHAVSAAELDERARYDVHEIHALGSSRPIRVLRGACRHIELEPVHDVTGELVAYLCPDCDAVYPPELPGP